MHWVAIVPFPKPGKTGLEQAGSCGDVGEICHKLCFDYVKLQTRICVSSTNAK